ncbi:unnamed protein product, partial [marine sediment metagenome]
CVASVFRLDIRDWPLGRIMQLPDSCFAILKKTLDTPFTLPILIPMDNRDNGVSVKSKSKVKGNNVAFPEFPDSANLQLEIPPLEQSAKSAQIQDLQNADPGAPDRFELKLDLPVLTGERKGKKTSLACRYIVGIIAGYPDRGYWKTLSEDTIAQAIRSNRPKVIRAITEAEEVGYLDVDRRGKCNRYHISPVFKRFAKIWVNPALVRDDGLSIVQAVWLSLVKFRQRENEATWLTHRKAADFLGVSYHSVARAANWSAALGYVQKRHRPWRRSSKNEYCLTCLGRLATGVSEPESARPKRCALGQTSKEGYYFNARFTRNDNFHSRFGLSFESHLDQEVHRLLRFIGITDSVARPAAAQWRYDPESVRQAIVNAALYGDNYDRQMRRLGLPAPRFNPAGYIVATLNGARREGHDVRPSKLAQASLIRKQGGARAAAAGRLTEAEFEKRKKEQIRRLLSTPAKTPTPGKSAIPAEKPQFCDKSADDALLNSTLEIARRNWAAHHKPVIPPRKADFSVDSCH